jgi:REP element-mobilizing transposase RayT
VYKYTYNDVVVRKRGRLPHWHVPNGLYFITYRLAGSLPRHIEDEIASLRSSLVIARERDFDGKDARLIEREIFKITEAQLHMSGGECWLRNNEVAQTVAASFEHRDGHEYDMLAYAVMPNHVHLVCRLKAKELASVMKTWKSYTAHAANKILGRSGVFWQSDYFDVLMRDSDQLQRTIQYVLDNPATAGLKEWPHVRSWPERIGELI